MPLLGELHLCIFSTIQHYLFILIKQTMEHRLGLQDSFGYEQKIELATDFRVSRRDILNQAE